MLFFFCNHSSHNLSGEIPQPSPLPPHNSTLPPPFVPKTGFPFPFCPTSSSSSVLEPPLVSTMEVASPYYLGELLTKPGLGSLPPLPPCTLLALPLASHSTLPPFQCFFQLLSSVDKKSLTLHLITTTHSRSYSPSRGKTHKITPN